MTSSSTLRRTLGLVALLAGLAGCDSDSDVLARVGGQTIRRDEFLATAQALAGRYPGPPDSAKVALLRDLVDREVLVQGAMRAGLYRDTTFLDLRRRLGEQMLRQRFYDELGTSDVAVSDAEVAELYRRRAEQRWVQVVFTTYEAAAQAALAQIRAGADFGAVANRFNPAGYTPPGGDLGYVTPGMMQLPLDDVIRNAPPGKVVGPIEAPAQGWFLVRVKDRRKTDLKPLEVERGLLTSILRQRKQREILVKALDRLRNGYHVHVSRGAAQALIAYLVPPALQGVAPAPLTLAQSARPLAEYDGGVYTMGDALQDLQNGQIQRPNFNVMSTVERWIEMRGLERAALAEAMRRQLDQQPEVQLALRQRLNDYLLQSYVTHEVLQREAVSEADLRAVFLATGMHPERLEQATFLVVALRDSATAAQLAATASQAEGLRDAVTIAALGVAVKSQTVSFPTDHPLWAALEAPLMATDPGGYTGPVPAAGLWLVAQLVTKNVVPQSFENLSPQIRSMLEEQAHEIKRTQLLAALTDSLKRAIPVAVYPARLKRLPWPAAPMPIPG